MTIDAAAAPTTCPHCGEPLPRTGGANFCEACGKPLNADAVDVAEAATMGAAAPEGGGASAPISAPTHLTPVDVPRHTGGRVCLECGGGIDPHGYCDQCGTKAPSERDHFRERPADWVAGVCDKGVRKVGNEDSLALLASQVAGERAVLVVLDGVTSSNNSAPASLAGARAAREVLRTALPQGMGTVEGRESAVRKVMADAAAAANEAMIKETDPDSDNPASATYTVVVLEGDELFHANIGDSRAYWFPDAADGVQLTVDDSAAQAQIDAGVPRKQAEASDLAHAITKWLGRDAHDIVPKVGSTRVTEPGWVLVCSDGLWNYASEPAALHEQVVASGSNDPGEIALHLVRFANAAGGHDNITVALARVSGQNEPATGAGQSAATSEGEPSDG